MLPNVRAGGIRVPERGVRPGATFCSNSLCGSTLTSPVPGVYMARALGVALGLRIGQDMQFDQASAGQPSSAYLTTATERTLELALRAEGGAGNPELQRAMMALCEEARRQGMRAEELIVLFKKTWQARPELQRMSREETSRLFDSVVTMCVAQYYDAAR